MSTVFTRGRRGRLVAATVTVVLCTVAAAAAQAAALSVLRRSALVSFDDPATQIRDGTTFTATGLTGPHPQAHDVGRLVVSARVVTLAKAMPFAGPVLSSGISRAPPLT